MTLFCDESGGLSADAMTFAAVAMSAEDADTVLARYRAITGLRGELKGSRISVAERGLLFEILMQLPVRAWIAVADRTALARAKAAQKSDLSIYSRLLELAVDTYLPTSGGACADISIDTGRYDPSVLTHIRSDIQSALGHWGHADMVDSRRSAGIQIADVVANSFFHIAAKTPRAARITAMLSPWTASKRLRLLPITP